MRVCLCVIVGVNAVVCCLGDVWPRPESSWQEYDCANNSSQPRQCNDFSCTLQARVGVTVPGKSGLSVYVVFKHV